MKGRLKSSKTLHWFLNISLGLRDGCLERAASGRDVSCGLGTSPDSSQSGGVGGVGRGSHQWATSRNTRAFPSGSVPPRHPGGSLRGGPHRKGAWVGGSVRGARGPAEPAGWHPHWHEQEINFENLKPQRVQGSCYCGPAEAIPTDNRIMGPREELTEPDVLAARAW